MSEASSTEGKVARAREFVARVFNDHRPELAIEYFTAQMTWHGGSLGTITGAENVTGLLRSFIGALPDLNAIEQDIVASDDVLLGKISEEWAADDMAAFASQLGALQLPWVD
jgi:SnoaL-like domain